MAQINEDFTGLSPATGSSWGDYVPPGTYDFIVSNHSDAPTRNGNEQHSFTLTINDGQYQGLTIKDNFVKTEGQKIAQQRLMAFLLSIGLPIQAGRMNVDSKVLLGRTGKVTVRDRKIEARDQYPERTVTNVVAYQDNEGRTPADIFASLRGKGGTPEATPAPTPAPVEAAKPSPVVAEPDDGTVAAPSTNGKSASGKSEKIEEAATDIDSMFA